MTRQSYFVVTRQSYFVLTRQSYFVVTRRSYIFQTIQLYVFLSSRLYIFLYLEEREIDVRVAHGDEYKCQEGGDAAVGHCHAHAEELQEGKDVTDVIDGRVPG